MYCNLNKSRKHGEKNASRPNFSPTLYLHNCHNVVKFCPSKIPTTGAKPEKFESFQLIQISSRSFEKSGSLMKRGVEIKNNFHKLYKWINKNNAYMDEGRAPKLISILPTQRTQSFTGNYYFQTQSCSSFFSITAFYHDLMEKAVGNCCFLVKSCAFSYTHRLVAILDRMSSSADMTEIYVFNY